MNRKFETVAAYIDSYNSAQQKMLQQMRSIIQNAAPKASEVISYNMPAYRQNGVLVYFAMATGTTWAFIRLLQVYNILEKSWVIINAQKVQCSFL